MSRLAESPSAGRRWWAAALPGAAVVMAVLAAVVPSGSSDTPAAQSVDVVETSYACPAGAGLAIGAGQVRAGDERRVRPEVGALTDPGAWTTGSLDADGVVVTETGEATGASGFFARVEQDARGAGLLVGRCPGVADDAWFLGAGSGSQHFSTLILTNLSSAPAVADVRLWGPDGPIDAVDATGIALEPYEVLRLPLTDLAAAEPELAIEVQRTRGALSAVVTDAFTGTTSGSEVLGASAAPAREQLVGGVVAGTGGKSLLLLNPGDQTARVDVEAIGAEGTFAVDDLQDLAVEPGSYREVAVPGSVGSGPQAFRVVGDRPVSASLRARSGDADHQVAEVMQPLDGSAIVPVDLGRSVSAPQLVLTAPQGDATVEVEVLDAQMTSLDTTSVDVAAGTTQSVGSVADGVEDAAYVVVRGRGDVVVTARYQRGDLVGSLAVVATPVSVPAPSVRRADG